MKNLTYPLKLIELLADGQFHSGEKLAKLLGISRVAVHYYIQHIKGLGLDIHAVQRRGYRLYPALTLLSERQLQRHFPVAKIHVLPIVNSTNTYLMERVNSLSKGDCCVAEYQHAGRGRRGRSWIAPFGQNIYLSFYWCFNNYQDIAGLSLATAVIVAETLIELTQQPIKVKWPNDLYLHNKKFAGILVESVPATDATLHTVIGIGINVMMSSIMTQNITQKWTNLYPKKNPNSNLPERNTLVIKLINELYSKISYFEQYGLQSYLTRWNNLDEYLNQAVKITSSTSEMTGIYRGINLAGELLLEHNKKIIRVNLGDVSLRLLESNAK